MRCAGLALAASIVLAPAGLAQTAGGAHIPMPGSGAPAGAQPGGIPAVPVARPAPLDPILVAHLKAWETKTQGLANLYVECEMSRKDLLQPDKQVNYTGLIYCMKPTFARLRIDNTRKPEDYMAYICDGKNVYEYVGVEKVVRQHPVPPGGKGGVGDNLLLEFMSGAMTANDVVQRFGVKMLKEEQFYVHIEITPILPKDQQEFDSLILVLFNQNVKGSEYLPAIVQLKKRNGQEVEQWTFKKHQVNVEKIKKDMFAYAAPPKGWQTLQAGAPAPVPAPAPKVARP